MSTYVRSVLLAVFAGLASLSLGQEECAHTDCTCEAKRRESKIQPTFSESCLSEITVSTSNQSDGCCYEFFENCVPMRCSFRDVEVTITPSESCTIRLVVDGEEQTPEVISSPTTKHLGSSQLSCDKTEDVVTIQVQNGAGQWKDAFELQLECEQCTKRKPPDES